MIIHSTLTHTGTAPIHVSIRRDQAMLFESLIQLRNRNRARLLVIFLGHKDELVFTENATE